MARLASKKSRNGKRASSRQQTSKARGIRSYAPPGPCPFGVGPRYPEHLAQLQPRAGLCGPAALRNALLCYGLRRSIRALVALCGTDEEGTSPRHMGLAAASLGFNLPWSTWYTAAEASAEILRCINIGEPVLMCVDRDPEGPWAHWITVVGATSRNVKIVDSSRPGPAVRRLTWTQLMQRLAVFVRDGVNRYDLYPLLETDEQ
jgi:hypothetical protein